MEKNTYKPILFEKIDNNELSLKLPLILKEYNVDVVVIEMIASYGLAVGKTVFDTCVWIGRFYEMSLPYVNKIEYIYRKEEKINLCNSMKAKDSNIRQRQIYRLGLV